MKVGSLLLEGQGKVGEKSRKKEGLKESQRKVWKNAEEY